MEHSGHSSKLFTKCFDFTDSSLEHQDSISGLRVKTVTLAADGWHELSHQPPRGPVGLGALLLNSSHMQSPQEHLGAELRDQAQSVPHCQSPATQGHSAAFFNE